MNDYDPGPNAADYVTASNCTDIVAAKRELDQKALAAIRAKINTIDETVDGIISRQIMTVAANVFGLEFMFGEWRRKQDSDSELLKAIEGAAAVAVKKHLPEAVRSVETIHGELKVKVLKELQKVYSDAYTYAFRDAMAKAIREKAQEQAVSDVEVILLAAPLVGDELLTKTDKEIAAGAKSTKKPPSISGF